MRSRHTRRLSSATVVSASSIFSHFSCAAGDSGVAAAGLFVGTARSRPRRRGHRPAARPACADASGAGLAGSADAPRRLNRSRAEGVRAATGRLRARAGECVRRRSLPLAIRAGTRRESVAVAQLAAHNASSFQSRSSASTCSSTGFKLCHNWSIIGLISPLPVAERTVLSA